MGSAARSGWLGPLVWSGLLLVVSGLPPQSFVVHSALWHMTIGQPDQSEVLASFGTTGECDCLTKCLTREDCLSYSHVPTDQSCTLYPVRGNVDSPRPERIRYRAALAYLGDWCSSDEDCLLLTSGAGVCRENTCSCPEGQVPHNRTTCEDAPITTSTVPPTSTTGQAATTTAAASVSTTGPTASSTSASSTASTTSPATSTIADPATSTTTAPTTSPTTQSTATTQSTSTVTATTEPTTTALTTTTTSMTTTTTTTTTTTITTTTPTTTTATTATPTTTTATTTTTTTTAAVTVAPDVTFVRKPQKGNPLGDGSYQMSCKQDPSANMVMVGLKDDPTYGTMWKDLDETNCAEYRHYPDLVIGTPGSRIGFSSGTDLYRCPDGSVLVALIDDDWRFTTPTSMQCAPVQGPYTVDTSDCIILPIDDPAAMQSSTSDTSEWPFQCPQLPSAVGIVSLKYSLSSSDYHWKGMECCRIKPTTP